MKKVIRINKQTGLYIEDVILLDNEETPNDCIEKPCQEGFYRPRWVGDWVEGLSQEEINAIRNVKEPIYETQKIWDMIEYMMKVNEIIPSEV